MKNSVETFPTIVGTNITSKINLNYVITLADLIDDKSKSKIERNIKNRLLKIITSLKDALKITDFLLKNPDIEKIATIEANSLESILFMASDLKLENREKVINLITQLGIEEKNEESNNQINN